MIHLEIELPYIISHLIFGIIAGIHLFIIKYKTYSDKMWDRYLEKPEFFPFTFGDLIQIIGITLLGPIGFCIRILDWTYSKWRYFTIFKIKVKG